MYPLSGDRTYIKNAWYMAAWSAELPEDKLLARTIMDTPIVLFRDADGVVQILDDRCPHRRYPLSKGSLEEGIITCNYHGYAFNGQGQCLKVPAMGKPVASQRALSYPVRERWNWIWVWLGEPALAVGSPLPDHSFVHADDPDWVFSEGGLVTLNARYMLLHDNLLDLSHLTFLHRTTIGSPGIASAKIRSRDLENGLEMLREVDGDTMEGVPLGEALGISGLVDRIMPQQFVAPCLHVTGPEFRSAKVGGVSPGHSFGAFRVIHGIVPETATTTHYFWGFTRNFRQHDQGMTNALRRNILSAVAEDVDASEDIERLLSAPAAPLEIHSPADSAGVKGRRIMQRLLDAEEHPASIRAPECTLEVQAG